ncbi:FAD-dependent oxidoreductase [Ruminococcus sp. OA3]|uniref:FAD-dependent oxidoreductase n=1 Tax=Ruminococcus sp. OA3 TaxID=2914164 RepID=UPI001F05E7A9|nr:FAD-dependent oxidoreductase [Ruminococcus sp. OA3]MCH1984097.1 FAD-dependent oxidoreductase [Ruminococcus sp. OA3]
MKVLIIGGVAAGTKAAAKLKRKNQDAEVKILTMSKDISYAGCGLPYYVGGVIQERSELIVNTPENFSKLTGALVETGVEVTGLDRENRSVKAVRMDTGEEIFHTYDKLVIATGASPVKPPVEGVDLKHVYFMRTPDDAEALRCAVESGEIKRAVVAGGGFIGLEVAENLKEKGIRVTVIDMASQIMPGFDREIAAYAEDYLADQGIMALTGTKLEGILGDGKVEKVKTDKRTLKADAVILSLGIRANTGFLADTGIELMPNRTVKVNEYLQTNDEDIYAIGDCAMVTNRITGEHAWSPMGSSANMEGRIAARNICGEKITYPGVLGTGIVKLPDLNAGRTGLSEEAARAAGFEPVSVITVVDDKAHYYPGAGLFIVKMVADMKTGKFLGIQCLGKGAVDKMVDIAVMALSMKASIQDLEHLDFAYAPPFSTAIHPFVHTVNVLLNKMTGEFQTITPVQFAEGEACDYRIVDASPAPSIEGVPYVDLTAVRGEVEGLGKEEKLLLVCSKGKRAYLLQNRLKHYGYTNTRVLEGGTTFNGKDFS